MSINVATVNMPDMNGQQDLQINNGQDLPGQANNAAKEGKASPDDLVTITSQAGRQVGKLQVTPSSASELSESAGVIVLDDDKNAVVRFYDKDGKVIAQYPPEDYIEMMKQWNQVTESMFHKKA